MIGKFAAFVNRTARWTVLKTCAATIVMVWVLVLLASTPVSAEDTYVCKCKGVRWIMIFPFYADCGNGFVGGNKGQVVRDLSRSHLSDFIPTGVSGPMASGSSQCGYYPDSGWNCGKMVGKSLPVCLND